MGTCWPHSSLSPLFWDPPGRPHEDPKTLLSGPLLGPHPEPPPEQAEPLFRREGCSKTDEQHKRSRGGCLAGWLAGWLTGGGGGGGAGGEEEEKEEEKAEEEYEEEQEEEEEEDS